MTAPLGDKLIAYIHAVRAAARRAYPTNELLADTWHMGWQARRVGRSRTSHPFPIERGLHAGATWGPERAAAWQCGWDAAGGTWSDVGAEYMPVDVAS